MKREIMLSALSRLPFVLINPGNWEDVGFTEREIWVNNKGYGYIACDEPTIWWEGSGIGKKKWDLIKQKTRDKSISFEDIQETTLVDLLDPYDQYDFDDHEQFCFDMGTLISTDYPQDHFYAMDTIEGIVFFDSESEFKAAYERDWADVLWEDLDDDLLSIWLNRLSTEDDPAFVEWKMTIKNEYEL